MYVCLCLCLSLYGREVTVGYARLRGGMGATFCHLAALRSAIEFLFWDHWETAVLGQILAGRSREQISAIWRPLSRLLNFSSGIIGKRPFGAKSWLGGHGRSWEVTVGYGRLQRRETKESGGTAGKRSEKNERKWRKIVKSRGKMEEHGGKWRKMEELRSSTESSVRWGSEQDSLQGDEKWYRGGEGLQSKQKSSKGAADGLGF